MDFRKIAGALPIPDASANGTELIDLAHLPSNILEALVPGYGPISNYIISTTGIDISLFVSIGLIAVALSTGGKWLFNQAEQLFRSVFMSSVYIDEHDDLFESTMAWLAENRERASRRSVRAKTQKSQADGSDTTSSPSDALNENGMFDFNKWSARIPPRYEPYYGSHMIWHKGNLIFFRRTVKQGMGQRVKVQFGGGPSEDDIIQLDCIGRSTGPVRALIKDIKTWAIGRSRNMTTIRHPTPKDMARFRGSWSKTSARPSRPMETVILDAEQKVGVIKDLNEYLHPSSPRWYAIRGIPYRRGYLFHGPPGTGKTSFVFALAGVFGLEIYAISLQEPTLTEGDLIQLFNGLPKRCIVLLEDVDAAGLLRDAQSGNGKTKRRGKKEVAKDEKQDGKEEEDKKKKEDKAKPLEECTLRDLAAELKAVSAPQPPNRGRAAVHDPMAGHPNRAPGTGISLSGLLNAIDGVATHEGRVLIMTTNHPEKLDAALVRPGRVDRRVEFKVAAKEQISELFVRMYSASDQVPDMEPDLSSLSNDRSSDKGKGSNANGYEPNANGNQLAQLTHGEVEALGVEFANALSDDTYTPAEIQGFLLLHKKEPRTAVEKVSEWAAELTADKEQQSQDAQDEGEEED